MNVERGRDWGGPGPVPDDAVVGGSDAEASDLVTEARRGGRDLPVVVLAGGDLCRTLGGTGAARPGGSGTRLTVDLAAALLDGKIHWFCAHLVARPQLRPGRWWVVANAAHHGRWNLAPRAHPGDGLLDILDADLSGLAWVAARRRLPRGDHVPHPGIRYDRVSAIQHSFDRSVPVRLDGQSIGRFRDFSVRVEAEALQVVV